MKAHTSQFKENIAKFGRELDSKITYTLNNEEVELGSGQLNSITPHYCGVLARAEAHAGVEHDDVLAGFGRVFFPGGTHHDARGDDHGFEVDLPGFRPVFLLDLRRARVLQHHAELAPHGDELGLQAFAERGGLRLAGAVHGVADVLGLLVAPGAEIEFERVEELGGALRVVRGIFDRNAVDDGCGIHGGVLTWI